MKKFKVTITREHTHRESVTLILPAKYEMGAVDDAMARAKKDLLPWVSQPIPNGGQPEMWLSGCEELEPEKPRYVVQDVYGGPNNVPNTYYRVEDTKEQRTIASYIKELWMAEALCDAVTLRDSLSH